MRDAAQGTPPRFIVSEIDGYPIMARSWQYDHAPMLSVSVLDRCYCYREVARFNEEDVRAGDYRTKHERREALRRRAHGLAASLEAQHA